jgi:3-keto-5-aminohexanoate cleavage enzyme
VGSNADQGVALLYDDSVKDALPDMCSLDTSLIDTVWMDLKFIYEWRREWLIKQANRMKELGIKPEIEVFNAESIEDVFYHLYPSGCLDDPVSLTLVMGMDRISQGAIAYTQRNHDFMIDLMSSAAAKVGAKDVDWTTMAIAANQLPATVYGMLKGGGVRTGMEDNIQYRHGELATGNAQLCERMVRIIRELEYDVATPDEAREILGLKKK